MSRPRLKDKSPLRERIIDVCLSECAAIARVLTLLLCFCFAVIPIFFFLLHRQLLVCPGQHTAIITLPDLLIVYVSCQESRTFPISKTVISTYRLSCHPETNLIDCHEAVPILEFLIEVWDRPRARRYIFVHAHETSWHYPQSVFDQIHRIKLSRYFRKNKFGAVFPIYIEGHGGLMDESQYQYVYQNTSMPLRMINDNNFYPCCATFFVDSDLVRTRSKFEYGLIISRLRQWSREHSTFRNRKPAVFCGRVMEYTWHILLTNQTFIPELPGTYRRVMK
jgi:hypothetical protein